MFLRIDASGPGSDQVSYKIGNHPSRQLIRRESEALGRLWFPSYGDEESTLVLHVRSNIPPIPDRLISSSIRYREWHRFAEWMESFLGKVFQDPASFSESSDTPDYRVQVGILPEPIEFEDALVDLFERASLELQEPPGDDNTINRWLRVQTDELSFGELLCRLAILIPSLYGANRPERSPEGYASLLNNLRGTWFNVHPLKEFLSNRFLSFFESSSDSSDEQSKTSISRDRTWYQDRTTFLERIGSRIADRMKTNEAQDQQLWLMNTGDGYLLPGLKELLEQFTTHLVVDREDQVKLCQQRVQHMVLTGDLDEKIDQNQYHWCPGGFQIPELDQADKIIWSPASCELSEGIVQEHPHRFLNSYQPDSLIIWMPEKQERLLASIHVDSETDPFRIRTTDWKEMWEQNAKKNEYSASWDQIEAPEMLSDELNSVVIGTFQKRGTP